MNDRIFMQAGVGGCVNVFGSAVRADMPWLAKAAAM
jgi:hypothetical protein